MQQVSHERMLRLKRWNTPTIYNGWEQVTSRDHAHECFNLEEVRDFMPQMGSMVGRAVTLVIEPGNPAPKRDNPETWKACQQYIASIDGPKIVVVQDMDKPNVLGSMWGEVTANLMRALGCVGTITDGAVRDIDEMTSAGIKAIARRLCVGHAHAHPFRFDCPVEVFGCSVQPGQLIHADKHGFVAVPPEDEAGLLEASLFMDQLECETVIATARSGKHGDELIEAFNATLKEFGRRIHAKFERQGEW